VTRRRYRRILTALAPIGSAGLCLTGLCSAGLTSAGCSSGLETGYVPRPLGVSTAERRGYYASPYTPEAAAAAQQSKADPAGDLRSRRPAAGPGFTR
jgi:hypothetical protein